MTGARRVRTWRWDMRQAPSAKPLKGPWVRIASIVYSEQLG